MKNKKGFTLIELLAVIIILGILMIIAIPSVTRYISDSRKAAYIDTAKQVASATKNLVNSGKLEMYDTSVAYYIPNTCIKVENGEKAKSPYGEFIDDRTYVVVTYDGQGYSYYWVSLDDTGTGVKEPISIDKLEEKDIETDLTRDDVKDDNGVGKEKVVIFSSTCDGKTEKDANSDSIVSMLLNEKESQLRKIDENVYIFKGGNPDNYVKFNCDSNDNCETWRIIGIYGNMIKIQNTNYTEHIKYNDDSLVGNDWISCNLKEYLNDNYYNLLSESSKKMIQEHEWFIGKTFENVIASVAYSDAKSTFWIGKIGLMSTYELLYASSENGCDTVPGNNNNYNQICGKLENNWMRTRYGTWTINASKRVPNYSLRIYNGSINEYFISYSQYTLPAAFLKSSVKLTGGTGTSSDPYTLGF